MGEQKLKVSEIEPNSMQPRKDFNEDALAELPINTSGNYVQLSVREYFPNTPCLIFFFN